MQRPGQQQAVIPKPQQQMIPPVPKNETPKDRMIRQKREAADKQAQLMKQGAYAAKANYQFAQHKKMEGMHQVAQAVQGSYQPEPQPPQQQQNYG